jgi:hypothetical protein
MGSSIYIGGAVDNSGTTFCSVLAKLDKHLAKTWTYSMAGCATSTAIDLLYADDLNHKIYGLGVYRSYATYEETPSDYFLLYKTGHDETSLPGSAYTIDCTLRRIEVVKVKADTL